MIDFLTYKTNIFTSKFGIQKDKLQLLVFLGGYLIAWVILAGCLPLSMYTDSLEQVVWSQTWQWGYYKHPPLPSILLSGLNHLFVYPSTWLTQFAAQSCNVVSLFYVWRLAKRMLSSELALTAVLITSFIGYHNFRAVVFDHNTMSLPFTAAVWYYFYDAMRSPERTLTWVLLGVAGGLAMLSKYSALLVLTTVFVYIIIQRLYTQPLVLRGLLISSLIFTIIIYPNLVWLTEHDWQPFKYLDYELNISDSRLKLLTDFFIGQFLRFWYMVLAVFYLYKTVPHTLKKFAPLDKDSQFLIIMLSVPLVLALAPVIIKGSFISRNWVTAFFLPLGILLVKQCFQQHNSQQLLQKTQRVAVVIHSFVLTIFLSIAVFYPAYSGDAIRTNFPSKQFAEQVNVIWQSQQSKPLKIVIANTELGGNILLYTRPEPTLLIDNNTDISHWVTRQDIKKHGALVVVQQDEKNLPQYAPLFNQANQTGAFTLPWGHEPHGKIMTYAWAIL